MYFEHDRRLVVLNLWKLKSLKHGKYDNISPSRPGKGNKTKGVSNLINAHKSVTYTGGVKIRILRAQWKLLLLHVGSGKPEIWQIRSYQPRNGKKSRSGSNRVNARVPTPKNIHIIIKEKNVVRAKWKTSFNRLVKTQRPETWQIWCKQRGKGKGGSNRVKLVESTRKTAT